MTTRHLLSKGFTLPEMLMTFGLLASVASFSVLAGGDSYQRALAGNDIERIASTLRRARNLAQSNVCRLTPCMEPRAQGVRIISGEMFMFEGREFSKEQISESLSLSDSLLVTQEDIVFLPGSGRTLNEEILRMKDTHQRDRVIRVSEAGVITIDSI